MRIISYIRSLFIQARQRRAIRRYHAAQRAAGYRPLARYRA